VLSANDFAKQGAPKVCFKHLLMQPRPVVLFTWDGWWNDVECTFLGPSAMFQRWNLQIRRNYDLLRREAMPTSNTIQVLLLMREARKMTGGGSDQQSRVFYNAQEISWALGNVTGIHFVEADLSKLPFEEQIRLVGSSSVLIGMHGAGIPASMHMAVGTKHCCGVIEIFPEGEFRDIHGYGNMARRMGHHYERIALNSKDARGGGGTYVDPSVITDQLNTVLEKIQKQPSCILPQALADPFLETQ
jgi:protein O-GlcNAc transferase